MTQIRLFLAVIGLSAVAAAQSTIPHRPPITGYSHMAIFEADDAASRHFYIDQLGWPRIEQKDSHGVVDYYVNPEQYIELVPIPSGFNSAGNVIDYIAFATPDAEGMRKYLRARGIPVPASVTREGDGRFTFMVRDFEGNKVEFVQGGSPHGAHGPAASPAISTHIIHMGLATRSDDDMRRFYIEVLGFHQFWQGWRTPGKLAWDQVQVPDGTDWLEFMVTLPPEGATAQLRLADHYSPGMKDVNAGLALLRARGMNAPENGLNNPMLDGRPKWSTHDPSGTRVEFMQFKPVKDPCCTPYTGPQPER